MSHKLLDSQSLRFWFRLVSFSLVTRKPVFGVFDQGRLKKVCAAKEATQRLKISDIETKSIKLSRQRKTKALIRLRGCTGWSAPLLFAYGINRFSHDVAHLIWDEHERDDTLLICQDGLTETNMSSVTSSSATSVLTTARNSRLKATDIHILEFEPECCYFFLYFYHYSFYAFQTRLVIAFTWKMSRSITKQTMTCASSTDSDQPGHSPSLIRVFAVSSMGTWPSVSSCGQRRLCSDSVDAQANLSLRWAHMSFCWFLSYGVSFTWKMA